MTRTLHCTPNESTKVGSGQKGKLTASQALLTAQTVPIQGRGWLGFLHSLTGQLSSFLWADSGLL